jgi:hypothetical protein
MIVLSLIVIGALVGVALIALETATEKGDGWLIMAACGLLMAAVALLVLGPFK